MVGKDQIVTPDVVEKHILLVRGQKVILDSELASFMACPQDA